MTYSALWECLDKPYLVHSNTSWFPGGRISAGVSWACQDLPIGVMRPKSTLTQSKWSVTGRLICAPLSVASGADEPSEWPASARERWSKSPAKCVHYTAERWTMNMINIKETDGVVMTLHAKLIIVVCLADKHFYEISLYFVHACTYNTLPV